MSEHWMRWEWDADKGDYSYNIIDAVTRIQGYTGATYQYPRLNPATFALQTMDILHSAVHEGCAFSASQKTATNAFDLLAPMTFYIITPNTTKWAHVVISGDANTPAYWELFEDTGEVAQFNVSGGVAYVPVNRNRNSDVASVLTITTGATVTAATTDALLAVDGIMKAADISSQYGFILKQNKKYLVRATTYTENNEGSLRLKWHEHTDLE